MRKSTLSAPQAARALGFTTPNPIYDAIRAGELEAFQRPPRRNGIAGAYEIEPAKLEAWATPRGLRLDGDAQPNAEAEHVESNVQSPYELIRELHIPFEAGRKQIAEPPSTAFSAGVLGVVTIPVEHYATLVAARAELEFIRANFELTWKGKQDVATSVDQSAHSVSIDTSGEQKPSSGRSSRRRA